MYNNIVSGTRDKAEIQRELGLKTWLSFISRVEYFRVVSWIIIIIVSKIAVILKIW